MDSGRRLIPTKLGVVLVHGYQKVCSSVTLKILWQSSLTSGAYERCTVVVHKLLMTLTRSLNTVHKHKLFIMHAKTNVEFSLRSVVKTHLVKQL